MAPALSPARLQIDPVYPLHFGIAPQPEGDTIAGRQFPKPVTIDSVQDEDSAFIQAEQ